MAIDQEYEFLGQSKEEKVTLVVKPHWLFFVVPVLKILAIMAVFLVLLGFFGASQITSYSFFFVLAIIVYIISINGFKWANTVYLLTDHRIICVYQMGLFNRVVSESTLGNILFISHKIKGPLATLLNVGSIHIRASGVTEEEIILEGISDPYTVQQQIASCQKKCAEFQEKTSQRVPKANESFWKAGKKTKIIR